MSITYPKAETFATKMTLPLTTCKVSKDLYGTTVLLLDERAAKRQLGDAGFLFSTPPHDAAMAILWERVRRLQSQQ